MRLCPAVRKIWLHLLAGVMWVGVGIMLVSLAARWLGLVLFTQEILLILAGLILALGIYLRLFSPIPKPYLAILYIGIGGGLFLSSLHYFTRVVHLWSVSHRTSV